MREGPIEEIYAYLAKDPDGTEGIAGFKDERGYWVPMLMTTEKLARDLHQRAQHIADLAEATVELVRFSGRERLDVLLPLPVEASVVGMIEEGSTDSIPFGQMSPTVRPSSEAIPALSQIVHSVVQGNQAGIAIEFFVSSGQKLPPIVILGDQASDLFRMGRQAFDAAIKELIKGKKPDSPNGFSDGSPL